MAGTGRVPSALANRMGLCLSYRRTALKSGTFANPYRYGKDRGFLLSVVTGSKSFLIEEVEDATHSGTMRATTDKR